MIKMIGLEGTLQDITEQKNAEFQASRQELLLRFAFLMCFLTSFFVIGGDGTIKEYQAKRREPAAAFLLKLFLGKRIYDVLPKESTEKISGSGLRHFKKNSVCQL